MVREIIMPKLGETMEEGYIVSWKKAERDSVEKGEVLFEVMSDKTNFEVESLHSGYLIKKLYEPSDKPIPVTTIIGYLADTPDEKVPAVESKTGERKSEGERKVKVTAETAPAEKESEMAMISGEPSERLKASPLAKKMAREAGIDISVVKGSGPGERIEKKDVLEYLSTRKEKEQGAGEYRIQEWTPLRRIIAKRLTESKREIPHYYLQGKFLVDRVVHLKENLKEKQDTELTYTDFLIFAAAGAIREYPLINARLINGEIRIYSAINIGLAVSVEQGLLVPVLKNCEAMDIRSISIERKKIIEKARASMLSENEMKDAGFIISNLGMYGVENFQPIISPPGVAIMGVGKIGKEMIVVDDTPQIHYVMNVSFSFDHRVIDGSYAGLFYKRFKETFENPATG